MPLLFYSTWNDETNCLDVFYKNALISVNKNIHTPHSVKSEMITCTEPVATLRQTRATQAVM